MNDQSCTIARDDTYLKKLTRSVCPNKHVNSLIETRAGDRVAKRVQRVGFNRSVLERAPRNNRLVYQVTFHRLKRQGNFHVPAGQIALPHLVALTCCSSPMA